MANERREGTMEGNTMEETNKTVSAPKGAGTVKVIGKMKRKEMQKLRDSKYEVKVEDSSPENQTLEEHDRRHHPDGYKEGDTCKFRENVKTETETDQADVLSPNNPPQTQNQEQAEESREKGEEESEAEKPLKLRVPTEEEKVTNSEEVEEEAAETKPPQEEENSEKGIEVAGEETDLTPEDKEYLDAVNKGDMETAQRMVREAAEKNGYETFGLHGTKGEFTIFDKKQIGTANDEGWLGRGFYFWDKSNRTYAYQYANGGKVMEVMLSMQEPYLISREEIERLIDAAERHDVETLEAFSDEVKDNGYDSVIDGDGQMLVFEPSQIKSADPVTYDDNGNVIPLSKRFNNKEDDIRYSKTTKPKEEGTDKGFGEEFWGSREGKRIKGYAQQYGAAIDEEKQSAQNGYAANFNESGKYKMPLSDGKFSKDFLKRVRGEEVWDKKEREEAEAAGKLLNNILGNVTIEFSDKPYDGGNSDRRKSIVVDEKTDAEYIDAVNKGDMETAERKVREAAAKAMPNTKVVGEDGLPLVVYHTSDWNPLVEPDGNAVFDRRKIKEGSLGRVFYFSREQEGQYGKNAIKAYLNIKNPFSNKDAGRVLSEKESELFYKTLDGEVLGEYKPETMGELFAAFKDESTFPDAMKAIGYDGIVDDRRGYFGAFDSDQVKSVEITSKVNGNIIPLSQRFKMDNPDIRYMTSQGKVVGEYDRKNGKITLYPGAKVKDVVHEYAHGLWQFAEQEAKEGRTTLRDKFHKIAKSAPTAVKKAVGEAYKLQGPGVIMEECFTHELARRSEQNQEFAKAIKTASGKSWYKRAWRTIKDTWGGLARKMGYGKADIDKMENMNAHESAEYILKQMAQGKHFGDINPTPDGGGKRKSISGIYTGSAADYDKPSLLKVGTGEGNQVYGWGLYGSNRREVAEGYAEMEVGKYEYSYQKNGKIINEREDTIESKVVGALKLWGDVETAIEELKGVPNSEDLIKELKEHGSEYKEYNPQNHIYQQTFFTNREKGDESHLIDWNNNVSEENKKRVAKGLAKKFIKALKEIGQYTPQRGKELEESEYNKIGNVTGQQLYLQMVGLLGSEKKASEFLADCDIDGIKYKADSHNEDGKGWNYVSFRDDNIKVDRKWKDGEEVEVNKEDK